MKAMRILLVDDDPQVLKVLGDGLRILGNHYEVTCAASAEAAIEALEADSYDLLISDLRLPNLSGLDLIAYARARQFNLPVILITGHPDVNLQAYQQVLGISACLYKPVRMRDLITCVNQCLGVPASATANNKGG